MLVGTCHCSAVSWTLDAMPSRVTACNCTICRRYGALWAYGSIGADIGVKGQTRAYQRGGDADGDIDFQFCINCGCITHFVSVDADKDGFKRAAVNVRMCDPSHVGGIPIRHFEGHESFEELSSDGRVVKDMWF